MLQRFFNILYTRNDPQLIPFYFRIPEESLPKPTFANSFYRRLLTQYFAFITRRPVLVGQVLSFHELNELASKDEYVGADIRRMEGILDMTDQELEERLHKLVKADILVLYVARLANYEMP